MTVLYLIVARSGSKRLPGKNLKEIEGVTLTGYKCLAAKKSKSCSLAMISTDSPQIADVARQYGVAVPFIRPAELATDLATTEDVVRHAMAWCEDIHGVSHPEAIQLLEPSSPFVRPADYDAAVAMLENDRSVNCVFGKVLYLFRWDHLKTHQDLYDGPLRRQASYKIPPGYDVDINDANDLAGAEWLAGDGVVNLSWAKT